MDHQTGQRSPDQSSGQSLGHWLKIANRGVILAPETQKIAISKIWELLVIATIHVKKGYQARLSGCAKPTLKPLEKPARVAVCPSGIPFIKPRLRVRKGDEVNIGTLLYEDKQDPRLQFLSPGGGRIEDIRYGPRRVIEQIVITLNADEAFIQFPTITKTDLPATTRSDLVEMMLAGGVWPLIHALPFRDIADPDSVPPAIFIALDDSEPFQTAPNLYLTDNEALFAFGIQVLQRLATKVYVAATHPIKKIFPSEINLVYSGKYPAGDPGVLLYHIKKNPAENDSWFITGQDVLMLARLLTSGRFPTERIVAVGGSAAVERHHVQTRLGISIADLVPNAIDSDNIRFVTGGIFKGRAVSPYGFLGLYETALTLLPEGNEKEFFALFNPGWKKRTYSRAYLSPLNRSNLSANCNRHGDERACIACMHCADVCPVDILPQLTHKAILAGEVEEALAHGLLDCVECGLCTYVCPSKIELTASLQGAKAAYRKERETE